jgi:hypothetical protein
LREPEKSPRANRSRMSRRCCSWGDVARGGGGVSPITGFSLPGWGCSSSRRWSRSSRGKVGDVIGGGWRKCPAAYSLSRGSRSKGYGSVCGSLPSSGATSGGMEGASRIFGLRTASRSRSKSSGKLSRRGSSSPPESWRSNARGSSTTRVAAGGRAGGGGGVAIGREAEAAAERTGSGLGACTAGRAGGVTLVAAWLDVLRGRGVSAGRGGSGERLLNEMGLALPGPLGGAKEEEGGPRSSRSNSNSELLGGRTDAGRAAAGAVRGGTGGAFSMTEEGSSHPSSRARKEGGGRVGGSFPAISSASVGRISGIMVGRSKTSSSGSSPQSSCDLFDPGAPGNAGELSR